MKSSGAAKKSKTKFSLFIIESLDFDDEKRRREGRILRDILRMSDHTVHYIYIRTARELEVALDQFQDAGSRYLHVSSHGNTTSVGLTLDTIPFHEFGEMVVPYLRERRLFMSACSVVNSDLARVILPGSGCHSLIGPSYNIDFDDAVMMWATFYHLMFRDPEIHAMMGGRIRWGLRRVRYAFQREFDYFRPSGTRGYEKVDVEER